MSIRRSIPHPWRLATIAALAAALAADASAAPPLAEALAGLPLSDAQKAAFARGEIVTAEPKATNERELSFAVGFVIRRPPAEIVEEAHLASLTPIDDIRASAAYRATAALEMVRELVGTLAEAPGRRAA